MFRPSILLIDPFQNLVNAYRMIFKEEGYSVESAANLEESCSILKKAQFSIIIIEYIPPHPATEAFIEQLKKGSPEVYVLMVANQWIDGETYKRLYTLGVDDFILKPYSPDKMLVHIQKGLKQRELVLKLQELERLNLLDPMSEKINGLIFNKNFFKKSLMQELKRARRHQHSFSLLLIKLAYGEMINNSSDRFMKEFLDVIRRNTREEDVVSKNNGEIGVLLPETDQKGCEAFLQRLYHLVDKYPLFQTDKALRMCLKNILYQSFTFSESFDIPESLKSLMSDPNPSPLRH